MIGVQTLGIQRSPEELRQEFVDSMTLFEDSIISIQHNERLLARNLTSQTSQESIEKQKRDLRLLFEKVSVFFKELLEKDLLQEGDLDTYEWAQTTMGIFPQKKREGRDREFRIVQDPEIIQRKLQQQRDVAKIHQEGQAEKKRVAGLPAFQWQAVPEKKESEDEKLKGFFSSVFPEISTPKGNKISTAVAQIQGLKGSQEDAFLVKSFSVRSRDGKSHEILLTGVFDGHDGPEAALYMKDHLALKCQETLQRLFERSLPEGSPLKELESEESLNDVVIWNVLKIVCAEMHDSYRKEKKQAGTTAAFSLLIDGNDLWQANLGDSRSILVGTGQTLQLSEDAVFLFDFEQDFSEQQIDEEIHKLRFAHCFEKSAWKRGGSVRGKRLEGMLEPARAVGNYFLEGLSGRPKIVKVSLKETFPHTTECFLVHATDGFWKATTDEVGAALLKNRKKSLQELAKGLVYGGSFLSIADNSTVLATRIHFPKISTVCTVQ